MTSLTDQLDFPDEPRPWHFRLRATAENRMLSRLMQVLETQGVQPDLLRYQVRNATAEIDVLVLCDGTKARRIGLLLRRMGHILSVHWHEYDLGDTSPEMDLSSLALAMRAYMHLPVDLDPGCDFWRTAPMAAVDRDPHGALVDGHSTDVRFCWNPDFLFVHFACRYQQLNLRSQSALLDGPTDQLWNHDVAEIFVGTSLDPARYAEFEVSPRGEWIDLDITTSEPGRPVGSPLHSGTIFRASCHEHTRTWYATLQIPFHCILSRAAEAGDRLRINLFRSQGTEPRELCWRPTSHTSFHVPEVFGTLILLD